LSIAPDSIRQNAFFSVFICIYQKKAVLLQRLRLRDLKTEKIFCSVNAQGIFFEKKFGKFYQQRACALQIVFWHGERGLLMDAEFTSRPVHSCFFYEAL